MLRISVITICFNNAAEVQATCTSVDAQTVPPFEHWIIDGSTTTAVREWVESTLQPAYRKAVHERDAGIADAFNKGLARASGDLILFLNSGDNLHDETAFHRVQEAFAADPSIQWLHGKFRLLRSGQWITIGKPFEKSKLYRGQRRTLHQTMYVRREVFERHGGFDPSLRISMDYDFLCRIADEKFAFIDYPLAVYDTTGVSSTNYFKAMEEGTAVFRRYYNQPLKRAAWNFRLRVLYALLNSPLGKGLFRIKKALGLENW